MTDLRKYFRKLKLREDLGVALPPVEQCSISPPDHAIASYEEPSDI
jgi:hypothetical protein